MKCKTEDKSWQLRVRPDFLCVLFLTISILTVYQPVRQYEFIRYDDSPYITANHHIKDGLTYDNLIWALTSFHAANWHPLTWASHAADITLYGMVPGRHHMTNVLLHIINSLLLFYIFRQMTGKLWQSLFVAALFALHPLHVESVAWISERKDVLCAFFGMLTIASYIKYCKKSEPKWYLLALFCFIAGLMSKPMLVTLPFVLLLFDYWPLGRIKSISSTNIGVTKNNIFSSKYPNSKFHGSSVLRIVLEKLPFLLFAVCSAVITLFAQHSGNAVKSLNQFPFSIRISNAITAYMQYIGKMFWPFHLTIYYPHPGQHPLWQVAGAYLILAAICFFVFRYYRRYPYLLTGWLWYAGALVPVIGIVQVGTQSVADRYTYLPLIGLFVIVSWGIPELVKRLRYRKAILSILSIMILCNLMFISWVQVSFWKNDITLFQHALDVTDDNYIAHNNLGNAFMEQGRLTEALYHFYSARSIRPDEDTYYNLGLLFQLKGNTLAAERYYQKTLSLNPNYLNAYINLGNVMASKNDFGRALAYYKEALRLNSDSPMIYGNLGHLMVRQGNEDEAIRYYKEMLRIDGDNEAAFNGLGVAWAAKGDMDQAAAYFLKAIRKNPGYSDAYKNLKSIMGKIK